MFFRLEWIKWTVDVAQRGTFGGKGSQMLAPQEVIVFGLVVAGLAIALLLKSRGLGSLIITITMGVGFIGLLVLGSADPGYTTLFDLLDLVLANKKFATAMIGGLILGAVVSIRR